MNTLAKPKPRIPLQYLYEEDEYGPMHTVGLPPDSHNVHNILDLEMDIDLRSEVAATCQKLGAPPSSSDHQYAWLDTGLDDDGWLWISYRPDYRPLHMTQPARLTT